MRSANRGNGNNAAYVNSVGNCNNNAAVNGNRAAADCVGLTGWEIAHNAVHL